MPTVLIRDILAGASTLMMDASPQFKRWTQAEMLRYFNEAQLIISRLLPLSCVRTDAVRLQPGTLQRLEFSEADVLRGDGKDQTSKVQGVQLIKIPRNLGPDGRTPGRPVRPVSQRAMDLSDPNWHRSLGKEVKEFIYDPSVPGTFYVWPGVPAAPRSVWIEANFTAVPESVDITANFSGNATATIAIGDEYGPDITNYIVARANMKEASHADPGKAQTFTALFTGSMNTKVEAMTGVNPNLKRLPLATDIGGSK